MYTKRTLKSVKQRSITSGRLPCDKIQQLLIQLTNYPVFVPNLI